MLIYTGPDGGREDKELKGIIPRMMDFVFDFIINADENIEFQVKCSFMEIYNEKIQDLIDCKYLFYFYFFILFYFLSFNKI